jgi:hypothetical protein
MSGNCVSLRSLVRPLLVGNCRVGHLHIFLAALTTRLRDFSELQQLNHQPRPIAIVNRLILRVRYRLSGCVVPAIARASHKARNVTPKSPKYDTVLFPFTVCCTLHLKEISRDAKCHTRVSPHRIQKSRLPPLLIQHQTTNSSHHARLQDAYPLRYQSQQTGPRVSHLYHHTHSSQKSPRRLLEHGPTPEIVTPEGLRNINKYTAARTKDLFGDPHAHNCELLLTGPNMHALPALQDNHWEAQIITTHEIIRREQRLALVRAGISVRLEMSNFELLESWLRRAHGFALLTPVLRQGAWLTVVFQHQGPIPKAGFAFKIPGKEDPIAFEGRLRTAGLVGGSFEVWSRPAGDAFWEKVIKNGGTRWG